MYNVNEGSKPPIYEITERMLSGMFSSDRTSKAIDRCMAGLGEIVGHDKLKRAIDNPEKVKERAIRHYVDAPTHGGDLFFMERISCMAICDIANGGELGLFSLSFPFIDNIVSSKLDAKLADSQDN